MNIYSEVTHFATFSGDGNDTFSRTRTIEHYSRSPFQKGNLVYLVGKHVIRITHHAIYYDKIFIVSPNITVETTNDIVNQTQTIGCICLF